MSAPSQRVPADFPPMTQFDTPRPSSAYLSGFLGSRGVEAMQVDLALALAAPPNLVDRTLHALLEHWRGERSQGRLVRTFLRDEASHAVRKTGAGTS